MNRLSIGATSLSGGTGAPPVSAVSAGTTAMPPSLSQSTKDRDAVLNSKGEHGLPAKAPHDEVGLDAANFALCGDSAGANLALGLALLLRDEGAPRPGCLGLAYGSFADRFDTRSHRAYGNGDLPLSTARMRWNTSTGCAG